MSRFAEVVQAAQDAMEAHSVPGVAIAVVSGGEEETAGLGVTSIENPLEVTPDTLFQIGSIGKTFTATAIMRLVEQGKVDLDVPVRTYLPDFRLADDNVAARVTIRHLLTHTGGWEGDYFDDFGLGDDALARMVGRLEELPQLTPLGEVWAYNNAGFYVAGRVARSRHRRSVRGRDEGARPRAAPPRASFLLHGRRDHETIRRRSRAG